MFGTTWITDLDADAACRVIEGTQAERRSSCSRGHRPGRRTSVEGDRRPREPRRGAAAAGEARRRRAAPGGSRPQPDARCGAGEHLRVLRRASHRPRHAPSEGGAPRPNQRATPAQQARRSRLRAGRRAGHRGRRRGAARAPPRQCAPGARPAWRGARGRLRGARGDAGGAPPGPAFQRVPLVAVRFQHPGLGPHQAVRADEQWRAARADPGRQPCPAGPVRPPGQDLRPRLADAPALTRRPAVAPRTATGSASTTTAPIRSVGGRVRLRSCPDPERYLHLVPG